jgi:glycyl-tRNA synthetase beta chain
MSQIAADVETATEAATDRSLQPATLPLLLEVGCEEIPARFLHDAQKGLGERLRGTLEESRLLPVLTATVSTYSTPRRLVVHVPELLAQQPDKVEDVLGPPVKVAIDAQGNYTRAAQSFAQKNGAPLEDLARTQTAKGEYLCCRKTTPGRPARQILAEVLPDTILGLSFPKSMYWTAKSGPRFVRPIRWVLAILGEGQKAEPIEFEIVGVRSGNFTYGHRIYCQEKLEVASFRDYEHKLRQAYVEIDRENRRGTIRSEVKVLLEESCRAVPDEELEEWLVNSTEWPSPIRGGFDARFLHLPREILITVMRDHQKYFAVEEAEGKLAPGFVTVLNVEADEQGLIRHGHERVLRARFSDAEFFWEADQHVPLRERVPLLEQVTYQAKLGSYWDKLNRMLNIGAGLCALLKAAELVAGVGFAESPAVVDPSLSTTQEEARRRRISNASAALFNDVARAIELCKCDLTTQMVQEFPELQGVVGGLCAQAQGIPEEISVAIYDHYLPLGAEGASPRTMVGALVSLADKLDSVVAGFAAGYEPTGSSDPFALRRQANGIIKVILEFKMWISLSQLVKIAADALEPEAGPRPEGVSDPVPGYRPRVLEFLIERLRYYFESVRGFRYDTVRAVIAAGADCPVDALARAEAMEALRGGADFEALSAAAKRIRNILSKSASAADCTAGEVDSILLAEPQERDLHDLFVGVSAEAEKRRAAGEYRAALEAISTLRPVVDRFFDKVLVMAEDRALRQNRLRLLKKLDELFTGIAYFAEIEGA